MTDTQGIIIVIALLAFYGLVIGGLIPYIIGSIKTAIGIKNDATALGSTKGTMFCLLTIFLGAVPAIVYACIRTTAAKAGAVVNEEMLSASEKQLKGGFKLMLVGTIIMVAAIVLLGAAMIFGGEPFIELFQ